MHVIVASTVLELSLPRRVWAPQGVIRAVPGIAEGQDDVLHARVNNAAPMSLAVMAGVLGLAVQGLMFATAMWLLLAAPGFLSAQDSLVRAAAAAQASR